MSEGSKLGEIRAAIDILDIDRARELLRTELKDPTAEVYYLASLAAVNDKQRLDFLQKALELDPFHRESYVELYGERPAEAPTSGTAIPNNAVEEPIPGYSQSPEDGWESPRTIKRNMSTVAIGAILVVAAAAVLVFVIRSLNDGPEEIDSITTTLLEGDVTLDNGFVFTIPDGALASDAVIHLTEYTSSVLPEWTQGDTDLMSNVYEVSLEGELEDYVMVSIPIEDELAVDSSQWGIQSEKHISVAYFDDETDNWVALPSSVDSSEKIVSASVSHLSSFAAIAWPFSAEPPTLEGFQFRPTVFYIDCEETRVQGADWYKDKPFRVMLAISDRDADRFEDSAELTLRWDYANSYDPPPTEGLEMAAVKEGVYLFDQELSIGSVYDQEWAKIATAGNCGNLRTIYAIARLTDKEGRSYEYSTAMDVRYEPGPEISLRSPVMNGLYCGSLTWDLIGSDRHLRSFDYAQIEIGKDPSLSNRVRLPNDKLEVSERSYRLDQQLEEGKPYYWRVVLDKYSTSSFDRVASQTGIFYPNEAACEEKAPTYLNANESYVTVEGFHRGAQGPYTWHVYDEEGNTVLMARAADARAEEIEGVDLMSEFGLSPGDYFVVLEAGDTEITAFTLAGPIVVRVDDAPHGPPEEEPAPAEEEPAPAEEEPAPSQDQSASGTLFIHQCEEDRCDLVSVDIKNRGETLFYSAGLRSIEPRVSPDGTRVLFSQTDQSGNTDIYTIHRSGDPATLDRLTTATQREIHASWSPDGSHIAYINAMPGRPWIMDADGSQQQQLAAGGESHGAMFGVDGRIYFQSYGFQTPTYDIYSVNSDGDNLEVVIQTDDASEGNPRLSPDGEILLFARVEATGSNAEKCTSSVCSWDLWLRFLRSGEEIQLTNSPAHELSPVWSPDGLSIAFSSNVDGDYEVYTMSLEVDTIEELAWTQITSNDVDDTVTSWIPADR